MFNGLRNSLSFILETFILTHLFVVVFLASCNFVVVVEVFVHVNVKLYLEKYPNFDIVYKINEKFPQIIVR